MIALDLNPFGLEVLGLNRSSTVVPAGQPTLLIDHSVPW
jgi:hypothetical protein